MHPGEVRHEQPDDVGVRDHDDGPSRVPSSDVEARVDGAPLHLEQALAAGEPDVRRREHHPAPELGASELRDRPTRPLAVADLDPRAPDVDRATSCLRERRRGLAASFQRARHDRVDADAVEPLDQPFRLPAAELVQMHAGSPAGEPLARGVRVSVTHEQQRRHAA